MLKKVTVSFREGLSRLKWFAVVFAERVRIEIAVIKLMYQSDEMDKKRQDLFRTIGERIYEIRGNPEKNIFKDKVVVDALEEIEKMEKDIEELKDKVSEIHGVSA